jgi:hypothetical protein
MTELPRTHNTHTKKLRSAPPAAAEELADGHADHSRAELRRRRAEHWWRVVRALVQGALVQRAGDVDNVTLSRVACPVQILVDLL